VHLPCQVQNDEIPQDFFAADVSASKDVNLRLALIPAQNRGAVFDPVQKIGHASATNIIVGTSEVKNKIK
jgi:hypothetical protein